MSALAASVSRQRRFLGESTPIAITSALRYHRFVSIMKVLLPLLAVALLGLIVAWPDPNAHRRVSQLPFTSSSEPIGGGDGLERARYTGVSGHNQPYTVTAGTVTPTAKDLGRVLMTDLQADMTLANGTWISLLATSGAYDRDRRTLDLGGTVDVYSDKGFEIHTASASIDLGRSSASGHDPVSGQGPFGVLKATGFEILDHGERLIFSGPVKLTVRPVRRPG